MMLRQDVSNNSLLQLFPLDSRNSTISQNEINVKMKLSAKCIEDFLCA